MIDDDEVGLKEKPEDTRYMYIKKITSKWDPKHRECGQTKDLIPKVIHYFWELHTRKWAGLSLSEGPGRGLNPYPGAPPTIGLLVVSSPKSKDSFNDNL